MAWQCSHPGPSQSLFHGDRSPHADPGRAGGQVGAAARLRRSLAPRAPSYSSAHRGHWPQAVRKCRHRAGAGGGPDFLESSCFVDLTLNRVAFLRNCETQLNSEKVTPNPATESKGREKSGPPEATRPARNPDRFCFHFVGNYIILLFRC